MKVVSYKTRQKKNERIKDYSSSYTKTRNEEVYIPQK